MTRALAAFALALGWLPVALGAAEGYPLQQAGTDLSNLGSLQRGARNFVNYCLGCHSLKFMRYSQLAADLALTEDEVQENLMFTGTKIYDAMETAMPAERARLWFGNAPPDLSLIVRSRSADYVYTFLQSFYDDPAQRSGADNAVLPQTAMPNVLAGLQGRQAPLNVAKTDAHGRPFQHMVGMKLVAPGELTPEEFDGFARDTVTFLEYVSEPAKAQRQSLGIWVILFLLMFTAFSYFLYKEYWKDVK
jgi:ubiquinol-cytochrome c reductase cytochrome c1 subunit